MIIYNVTAKVNAVIHDEWMQWQRSEHIPEIMSSGCFLRFSILRLMETDDNDGPTYAIQYFANSKADYNRYIELFAPALRRKAIEKWGDQFVAFRSLMEVVQ